MQINLAQLGILKGVSEDLLETDLQRDVTKRDSTMGDLSKLVKELIVMVLVIEVIQGEVDTGVEADLIEINFLNVVIKSSLKPM